MEVEKTT